MTNCNKLTRPDVSLHLSFVNRKLTALDFITVAPNVLSFTSAIFSNCIVSLSGH